MAKPDPLGVWLYGLQVAELVPRGPGAVRFRYSGQALEQWPSNTPLLSCSLPLGERWQQAGNYFRGMLPEGRHLQAFASAARVPTYDTFGILARFGRDVAGAAVIAAEGPGERIGTIEPYTHESLEDEVGGLEDRPLAIYDDSELSIAGLQNKLLLVATDDGWARPVGGRPSTHILKVEDRRYPGMVTMECACLRLARALDLTTIDAQVQTLSGIDCLIVSRFDRRESENGTERVHQEDACQALDRDPTAARGRGKYESAGGPRLAEIAELLDRYGNDQIAELAKLAAVTTFTVLIGNADAHGKNLSLMHDEPGVIRLAPLYDTVPTVLWPRLPDRAAMTVNGRTKLSAITRTDVVEEAGRWRLDPQIVAAAVDATAERLAAAIDETDCPDGLAVAIRARTERFLAGSSVGP